MKRRLQMEALENRQLLTAVTGYTYDAVGNGPSTTDASTGEGESRDADHGDGDLDIYVTNGPGSAAFREYSLPVVVY